MASESSPKESGIRISATTSVCAGGANDGALDRLRIERFAARGRIDDPVPVGIEREGYAGGHVTNCDRSQGRATPLHGASSPSKRSVTRLRRAASVHGAVLRRDLNGNLDLARDVRRMLDPQREDAPRREKTDASDDLPPTLAVGTREDEVLLSRTDAFSALAEPVRNRPQPHADDDRSIDR